MQYMEFIEALVNAETEDERMSIVKEHSETFKPAEGGEDLQPQVDELTEALNVANESIATLKQEMKDRFFGHYDDEPKNEESEEAEETEETETETKTLNDLGFGQKNY